MKTYICYEPAIKRGDPEERILTEDQIIAEYWDYWCSQMRKVSKEDMISRERCIEDWITVHWAMEVTK